MPIEILESITTLLGKSITMLLNPAWSKVFGDLSGIGSSLVNHLANNGLYEVLDYESTLELRNSEGTNATFSKFKKVRYLQDNIIAYQDNAWGDGEILLNYRTNRGIPVDRYRSGFKTYVLLSLREVRNRNDIDEFNIQWDIHRGFLTNDGYWSTDVNQRTKHVKVNVIFPKSRPPLQLTLEENNRQRTTTLGREAQKQLPDGRWLVTWENDKPQLHELYVLRWTW